MLRATVPALIFLLLVIPPPMNLDGKLVLGLQGLTSKISSQILDRIGTLHFLDGNTVEVGVKSYFVDKACSGINSLFSTIAVTLFCVLYFGAHWLRTVCLFMAVVFWVVVANVTRVTLIVWLDRRFGIDLSKEQWDWAQDADGMGLRPDQVRSRPTRPVRLLPVRHRAGDDVQHQPVPDVPGHDDSMGPKVPDAARRRTRPDRGRRRPPHRLGPGRAGPMRVRGADRFPGRRNPARGGRE